MKRILCLVILCALLFSSVSCSTPEPEETQDTSLAPDAAAEETVEEEDEFAAIPEPELPDKDYGGAAFTYLIRGDTANSYREVYVYADELTGEIVNDAIFNRNLAIEEKFKVKIQKIEAEDAAAAARTYIQANDKTVDVVDATANSLPALGSGGYLYDFHKLTYVDPNAEYWGRYAAEDLDVAGKLFFMPCDISMRGLQSARFIYFNKNLLDQYHLDDPYELVHDNKWTLDRFLAMIPEVSADLDGNGIYDKSDLYGMLTETGEGNGSLMHLLTGCGVRFTDKDADGKLYVSAMSEKTQDVITKIRDALKDQNYCIDYIAFANGADTSAYNHLFQWGRSRFAAGQFLFVQNGISEMDDFREMEDDFGLVPNPKYNEEQENYYHKSDPYSTLFSVPVSCGDVERTDILLEYSAWLSHSTLLPAYYEVTVKEKRIRDEQAVEMLDIVRTSVRFEISQLYNVGIASAIWSTWDSGNLASTMAKSEKVIKKQLEKLEENIAELES